MSGKKPAAGKDTMVKYLKKKRITPLLNSYTHIQV